MPPSLLKFLLRAASLTHAKGSTLPTSDQVPELIKAQSSPCAGIPAMADTCHDRQGQSTGCCGTPAEKPGDPAFDQYRFPDSLTVAPRPHPVRQPRRFHDSRHGRLHPGAGYGSHWCVRKLAVRPTGAAETRANLSTEGSVQDGRRRATDTRCSMGGSEPGQL